MKVGELKKILDDYDEDIRVVVCARGWGMEVIGYDIDRLDSGITQDDEEISIAIITK